MHIGAPEPALNLFSGMTFSDDLLLETLAFKNLLLLDSPCSPACRQAGSKSKASRDNVL